MEHSPEETSVATIELLESRLRRVEHILYGSAKNADVWARPVVESLAELERRFASLVSGVRVYAELLKICTCAAGGRPLAHSQADGFPSPQQTGHIRPFSSRRTPACLRHSSTRKPSGRRC